MNPLILAAAAAYFVPGACLQVSQDRILFGDVAHVLPAFRGDGLSSEPIGWTPSPGTRRVLTAKSLVVAAHAHGLEIPEAQVRDVCVERAGAPLRQAAIESALSGRPDLAGVAIEV